MNSLIRKYIVSELQGDKSLKFDSEFQAYNYIRSEPTGKQYMIMPTYESADPSSLKFRATIVLTVYQSPQKTLRAIECCLKQNTTGIEIIIYGDGCANLQNLIDSHFFDEKILEQQLKGNDLIVLNNEMNFGGYGYMQRNRARDIARGKFTMYVDSDDMILPNHVSTRLAVAETDLYDMIGFETWLEPNHFYRDTRWEFGKVGHAEIIIRTEFLKNLKYQNSEYGHDFHLIQDAINAGARTYIHQGKPYTYIVKSMPGNKEQGID